MSDVPMLLSHAPVLRVTAELRPPVLEVRLEGEIDLACSDLLEAVTHVELGGVTTVTVDLGQLEFADLAGVRALLAFRSEHVAGGREVRLVAAQPVVRRLFDLCGLGELLAA